MIIKDTVCPFCGCLCDDIEVTVEDGKIVATDNACTLGTSKFLGDHRMKSPIRRVGKEWKEISYDEAIDYTVDMLLDADRPLLYGWSGTHGEAQCVGVHMAELLKGVIDNTSSVCHGPSILAIQEVGHPGCTLGQVKNRADIIIYWGCNPIDAHPRHLSRYTRYANGFFLENSFRDRKVIVVDVRKSQTTNLADEFVQIKPGCDYAVLSALRAIVRGKGDDLPRTVGGVQREQLFRIVDLCKKAKFGAVYFGLGLTMTAGKYKNIRNAIELVDELNRHTKFTISAMRGHYNVYGSNEVNTWMTGYPFGIDFSRGIAFYNPGETTAVDILARKECDACLIVASDPAAHFPRPCIEHLAEIPVVQIDPYANATTAFCDVQIPVGITGIDAAGTAYRMDGVPIRTKKVLETAYPSDEEILGSVYARIQEVRQP
ncbi:formylmethanofuran dehydrogenase subunit B [Methanoculleus sp. FWC-SCC1]|uniref:Formylmethanofuran dehydrogenase subunit B n=1 Tax=Methanoculleus frigidifontis TaxID=2584085 RepID=A0ABT8M618_9EURY|nr:formylmethanofuran dehydrogenase subunit B [Methanoculleus sp. FWC-SCC1]MDN7023329.1 formylmethanofuran dehydrogenase subunit B [Methanoculleus sp. FWC-SCC1]